jgi:CheY-like chemotaxis protein
MINSEANSEAVPAAAPMSLSRVMLVDTSRATLEVCVGSLNELGVREIVALRDGYEALGRLLKEPFDAIITSLRVPMIDGQTLMPVLRIIPGPNQRTPVILLTSSATALDPTMARPDHVVEKNPHMTERLKKILGALAGKPELARQPAAAKIERVLKKIVLVDDSLAIHQLLRASFKRFPEIVIATLGDPTTAVDFVRHEQPDFVLLDLNMPQLSGKEVMRDIKASADLQGIPVAFFTADESVEERGELLDLGACHVFKKPFFPKTFADALIKIYNER